MFDTSSYASLFLKGWNSTDTFCIEPTEMYLLDKDVRKTENCFGFGLENRTVQKFDICSGSFPAETVCSSQFKLNVTKISCIQCADKECFETLPDDSVLFVTVYQLQNESLVCTVQHSSNAVIFAVN